MNKTNLLTILERISNNAIIDYNCALEKKFFDENANTAGINETLPTLTELKAELKERKAAAKLDGIKKPKIIYKTESGIAFNVEYLINAIEGTGTNIIHVIDRMTPALFAGEKEGRKKAWI